MVKVLWKAFYKFCLLTSRLHFSVRVYCNRSQMTFIIFYLFHFLHSIFFIPLSLFHFLYSIFFIPFSLFHSLYSTFFIPFSLFHFLYSIFFILFSLFHPFHSIFFIPFFLSHFLHSILYISQVFTLQALLHISSAELLNKITSFTSWTTHCVWQKVNKSFVPNLKNVEDLILTQWMENFLFTLFWPY